MEAKPVAQVTEAVPSQQKNRREEIRIEIQKWERDLNEKDIKLTTIISFFNDVFGGSPNNYKPKFGEGEAVRRAIKMIDQLRHDVKSCKEIISGLKDEFYSVHNSN